MVKAECCKLRWAFVIQFFFCCKIHARNIADIEIIVTFHSLSVVFVCMYLQCFMVIVHQILIWLIIITKCFWPNFDGAGCAGLVSDVHTINIVCIVQFSTTVSM